MEKKNTKRRGQRQGTNVRKEKRLVRHLKIVISGIRACMRIKQGSMGLWQTGPSVGEIGRARCRRVLYRSKYIFEHLDALLGIGNTQIN